jgi:signal transduction histidine kinase
MRFPPPARYYAPLLVLVFGLMATWLDYELNLANDRARNLADVTDQTKATGARLAKLAERRFAHGDGALLADDLAAWTDEPWLKLAAVVDENGVVVADSAGQWTGRPVRETPLAPAMKLALRNGVGAGEKEKLRADEAMVFAEYAVPAGGGETNRVLVLFDRTGALAQARIDAGRQLRVEAAVIGLLCLSLWAALHFGFAARLARLTRAVRAFGEGRAVEVAEVSGGDEVRELSAAFAAMSGQLGEREAERVRLERELLESTERERRRIGQDLHDGIGQQLTAASLATNGLVTALESAAPGLAPQGESLGRQLRETIAEVRALSHGLAPVALQDEGLMNALHALADTTARSSGVRCVFECPQPVRVADAALAGHLYRIAQEAVTNALKHAAPREIRLGLERRDGALALEVDDDGEGLPETLAHGGGIGLRVMRHRAELIGAMFEIGSPPAGGTRIACHIPVPT